MKHSRDLSVTPWEEFTDAEKKIAEAKMSRMIALLMQLERMGFMFLDVDHDGSRDQLLTKGVDKDAPFFTRRDGGRWQYRNNQVV